MSVVEGVELYWTWIGKIVAFSSLLISETGFSQHLIWSNKE